MPPPEHLLALKAKADTIISKYSLQSSDTVTAVTPFLKCTTARELSNVTYPPLKWAVEGILPAGLTVLAGAPKIGKSWFCLGLAQGIATGQKVFSHIEVEEGKVLYLALEDNLPRIQARLKLLNEGVIPRTDNLSFVTETDSLPAGITTLSAIEQHLSINLGTRLVIIDVYARVKPLSKYNSNSYAEDYKDAIKWKKLADSFNTAIVLVHHTRKQYAEDFINSVSGTNGLTGAADTVLVIERSRQSDQATLEITSRDAPENKLAFSKENANWVLLGDAGMFNVSTTRRLILELVQNMGSVTPKALADSDLDISYDNAKQTLKRMFESGELKRDNGRYFLPETQDFEFN